MRTPMPPRARSMPCQAAMVVRVPALQISEKTTFNFAFYFLHQQLESNLSKWLRDSSLIHFSCLAMWTFFSANAEMIDAAFKKKNMHLSLRHPRCTTHSEIGWVKNDFKRQTVVIQKNSILILLNTEFLSLKKKRRHISRLVDASYWLWFRSWMYLWCR